MLWSTERTEYTKGAGQTTKEMGKDMSDTLMEIPTKEISKEEKHMVRVYTIGQMVRFMMVSGVKELKMGMECGREFSVIAIWANG